MKLLVKVVGARYSDTPQTAFVQITSEVFATAQKLISEAPMSLRIEKGDQTWLPGPRQTTRASALRASFAGDKMVQNRHKLSC
jgi:hypothetical protein